MPIYNLKDMEESRGEANSKIEMHSVSGEFMKVGVLMEPEGEGPPLHTHPNEEQFIYVLEGELHFILGDEDRVVGAGTLIHVPRGMPHRSRPVNGPAKFFTVKSPVGDGRLDQDYNIAEGAEQAERKYPGASDSEKG